MRIIELGLSAPLVLSLILQHPRLLCYTTIEIDLSRHSIETRFKDHNDLHNPHIISEIVRRCHSIPVTLRALLAKYRVDSTASSIGAAKKRSAGGPSSGSGSSSSSSSSSSEGFDSKPPQGGFSNGNGDGDDGSGGDGNDGHNIGDHHFDGMDQDAVLQQNRDDDEELHVTPRSLISHDANNGLVYTTIPNRLVKKNKKFFSILIYKALEF